MDRVIPRCWEIRSRHHEQQHQRRWICADGTNPAPHFFFRKNPTVPPAFRPPDWALAAMRRNAAMTTCELPEGGSHSVRFPPRRRGSSASTMKPPAHRAPGRPGGGWFSPRNLRDQRTRWLAFTSAIRSVGYGRLPRTYRPASRRLGHGLWPRGGARPDIGAKVNGRWHGFNARRIARNRCGTAGQSCELL